MQSIDIQAVPGRNIAMAFVLRLLPLDEYIMLLVVVDSFSKIMHILS